MNSLANISNEMTMSSLDIAEVVNSRHDSVKRTIERLSDRGTIQRPPMVDVKNAQGQLVRVYDVGERESYIVVAQLSPEFTAKLVDFWQAHKTKAPIVDPSKMLDNAEWLRGALIGYTEKVMRLEARVEQDRPKVASYEHLTRSDGTFCLTDAAKALGVRRKDLIAKLKEKRWIYRRFSTGTFVGYSDKEQQGLIDHKVNEITTRCGDPRVTQQVRITAKGMAKLGEAFAPALPM